MKHFLKGALIAGGTESGKSRLLEESLNTCLTLFPEAKVVYAGMSSNQLSLENNLHHEFFIRRNLNDTKTSANFLQRVKEIVQEENRSNDVFVVIDDYSYFFVSPAEYAEFAETFNQSYERIHLWMTVQNLNSFSRLFNPGFVENFSEYIVLRDMDKQDFFDQFFVDTTKIVRGGAIRLHCLSDVDFTAVNLMSEWRIFRKSFYFADKFSWLKFLWKYYFKGLFKFNPA